jgi:hypothetical protein
MLQPRLWTFALPGDCGKQLKKHHDKVEAQVKAVLIFTQISMSVLVKGKIVCV